MHGEIRTYFELEARELVDRLTRGVAQLDGSAASAENIRTLQRAAHTLKGAAHVVGEAGIAELAHTFEDALAEYQTSPEALGAQNLLDLTDRLAEAFAAASDPSSLAATTSSQATITANGLKSLQPTALEAFSKASSASSSTVRVDREEAGKLLTQINIGGALVAALRGSLQRLAQLESSMVSDWNSSGPSHSTNGVSETRIWPDRLHAVRAELQDEVDRLDRQMIELHRATSRLSLISTGTLLIEAGRIVRATAAAVQREVVCVTHGGGDRVDLQVVEALQDALLHLIRNAIVHGVESLAERRAAGKPPVATITIVVTRQGSDVVLTCADDGRGIDLEPVRVAAVERGLMSPTEAAEADSSTLLPLLLRPGFSTRHSTDEMAGRGVGLDAVHQAAVRLHGEVIIESEQGRGTTFTLIAPHAYFAVTVLEVTAAGVRYAIPVELVEQTLRLQAHHKVSGQGARTVLVDRETMPYLMLQDVMPGPQNSSLLSESGRTELPSCVVLRTASGRLALAVDRVEATNDILMQPLPAIVGATPSIAGAALSPGGQPFLVLNPSALFAVSPDATGMRAAFTGERTRAAGPILVIDDSLTTRMLEQSILEAEGYTVDLAVSAEQGLMMAQQKKYALFLVDVEMPGMNGFDFVRKTKADATLGTTPAILVTSLDSAEDRERGRAAGAVSYVVKGEFNQQVYLDRIRAVMGGAD